MANYAIGDYKSFEAKQQTHATERVNWTFKDYMKNDSKALAEMKVNDPKKFSLLFRNQYGSFPKI